MKIKTKGQIVKQAFDGKDNMRHDSFVVIDNDFLEKSLVCDAEFNQLNF